MDLSPGHLLLILLLAVVVLIIWGPKRLPGLGSGMGGAIREFRKSMRGNDTKPTPGASEKTPPTDPPAPS